MLLYSLLVLAFSLCSLQTQSDIFSEISFFKRTSALYFSVPTNVEILLHLSMKRVKLLMRKNDSSKGIKYSAKLCRNT